MILRRIITTDEPSPGWVVLKLECGHQVGPISCQRVPKNRKGCLECELIADHSRRFPDDHQVLVDCLRRVPMDDHATALVEWIDHMTRARHFMRRGIDLLHALAFSEQPTGYPLRRFLYGDDDETFC